MAATHRSQGESSSSQAQSLPAKKATPLQIPTLPHPAVTRLHDFSHLNLDTFSPVNQNGCYDFDRVLKSGYVQKRTRKTKSWKPIFMVLRSNYLSIYKDKNEEKLRQKIDLADLTAVTSLKDPKNKRHNLFGLFTPSRNYHLEASSAKDAAEWVELLRQEARIEEEEEEMFLASPANGSGPGHNFDQAMQQHNERILREERLGSSSPEPSDPIKRAPRSKGFIQRRESHTIDYSGNELASHSDMSDSGGINMMMKKGVMPRTLPEDPLAVQSPPAGRPVMAGRNISQMSVVNAEQDPERVVWQGYLLFLKSKSGVRQWKHLWMVVRARNFALYKNDSEYSPMRITPLSSVINAVEIDPLSKSKKHCFQIITEEKSYKFCVQDEDTLDKSLGAFKSLLAKRKEHDGKKPQQQLN